MWRTIKTSWNNTHDIENVQRRKRIPGTSESAAYRHDLVAVFCELRGQRLANTTVNGDRD